MDVIFFTIPGMLFLGLGMVAVFIWAIRKGQYEDMEGDGQRILMDEDEPVKKREKKADNAHWPDAD